MKKNEKTRIKFNYDGVDYTLEFTADSLKKMQARGFNFTNAESITAPEELFSGSFIANHNNVPERRRQEIYHDLAEDAESGDALLDILGEMVSEAMDEITYHSGNTKWEVVR